MSADATQRAPQGTALVAAPGFAAFARRYWLWLAAFVAALLLPWLFFDWSTHRHSGFALTMLSEIGLMGKATTPPVVLHVDHPFLYIVADQQTGAVLFIGHVVDPGKG